MVALGCAFVRLHIGVLALCSVFFTAGALLLLEYSLNLDEEGRHSPPATPNGLIVKSAPQLPEDASEEAMITMRDMAAVVALLCSIASLAYENFKRYEWAYRPQSGPIDSQKADIKLVMVLYNQWNSTDDLIGIILGTTKALLLTAMVSKSHNLVGFVLPLETCVHSSFDYYYSAYKVPETHTCESVTHPIKHVACCVYAAHCYV